MSISTYRRYIGAQSPRPQEGMRLRIEHVLVQTDNIGSR